MQGKIDSHFLRVLEHAFIRVMKYRTQLAADDFNLKTPQDFEPSSLYWESFFYRVLIPLLMSYRFLGHAVPKNFDPALWLYRAFLKSHGDVSTFEPLSSTELIDFVLTYQAHCEANPVQYMKDMRAISEKSLSIKRLYLDRLKIRLKNELMFLGQDERYPPIQRAVENVLSPLGYRVSTGETRGNWHQRLFFTLIPITDIRGEEEHLVSLRTLDLAAMSVMPYGGWTQEVRTYRLPSSLERFLWNQDDLEAQLSSPSGFRFFNGCDAFQLESLCTVLTDTDLILRFLGGGVFHALPAQLKMRDRIFSVLLTEPLSMRVETLDDDENAMWRFVLTQVLLGGVANGVANSCFLQPLRSEHWRNPPRADLIEFQAGPSLPVRDSEVAYGYQTLSIRQALRDWREHGQILVPVLRSLGMSVRGIDPSHFKRVAERALFLKHVLKRGDVLTLEDVWRAFHNREKTELKRMVKIAPNSPIKCVGKVRANHFGPAFPQFDEKRANGEQTSFLKYLMDFPLDLSKWNVEEFKSLSEPLKLKLIEKWCRRAERQLREFQKNSKSSQAELIKIAEEK
ncbi:MAG: hypothetical protein EBX40_06730, partial [Gammaproteobacteria bacterium]|nr:hypothetical protein [Gammaproteobacteria bacterium]